MCACGVPHLRQRSWLQWWLGLFAAACAPAAMATAVVLTPSEAAYVSSHRPVLCVSRLVAL